MSGEAIDMVVAMEKHKNSADHIKYNVYCMSRSTWEMFPFPFFCPCPHWWCTQDMSFTFITGLGLEDLQHRNPTRRTQSVILYIPLIRIISYTLTNNYHNANYSKSSNGCLTLHENYGIKALLALCHLLSTQYTS